MLNKIKQYGIKNAFRRLIKKILRLLSWEQETFFLYGKKISSDDSYADLPSEFEAREIFDVEPLKKSPFDFNHDKLALFKKRFLTDGFHCYGAFKSGILVYYCWISTSEFDFPSGTYKRELSVNEGLLFDAQCHSSARGAGVHGAMNGYRCQQLVEKGKDKALVVLLKENIPAIRSQIRIGFELFEQINIFRLFGKTKVTVKNMSDQVSQ